MRASTGSDTDLAAAHGGTTGDGAAYQVVLRGTNGDDAIDVFGRVDSDVLGAAIFVRVSHVDTTDAPVVEALSRVGPGSTKYSFAAPARARTSACRPRTQFAGVEPLQAEDIPDAITYIVTRPGHVAVNEQLIRPTELSAPCGRRRVVGAVWSAPG